MASKSFKSLVTIWVILSVSAYADTAACDNKDAVCESNAAPASLLQKAFHSDGKANIAQDPLCTGIMAQGRCWYLGEVGETCISTCARNGMGFSYVVADLGMPITPRLVGHEPAIKQQPWAALECYVPGEDRFHTANRNAAKHTDDIGYWSELTCALACPCSGRADVNTDSGCSWKQPPACAANFIYKGAAYTGCAPADSEHSQPWCQHQYTDSVGVGWSYCEYSCGDTPLNPPAPQEGGCDWVVASGCVQEFDYQGAHYVGCTAADHDTPWCSNTDPYTGSWNHCVYTCSNGNGQVVAEANQKAFEDDELCYWQPSAECSRSFEYKSVQYTGCVAIDHPTPWCSRDPVHKGSWTTCTRVCSRAGPAVPSPVPVAPSPAITPQFGVEEPCYRNPQAQNDVIGATVTLDEAGYKIAASAGSPINMKRFICRVSSKIGCRVTDLSSLMAFVPYYSGAVSSQTYNRLETELATLCHTGGQWLTPLR